MDHIIDDVNSYPYANRNDGYVNEGQLLKYEDIKI